MRRRRCHACFCHSSLASRVGFKGPPIPLHCAEVPLSCLSDGRKAMKAIQLAERSARERRARGPPRVVSPEAASVGQLQSMAANEAASGPSLDSTEAFLQVGSGTASTSTPAKRPGSPGLLSERQKAKQPFKDLSETQDLHSSSASALLAPSGKTQSSRDDSNDPFGIWGFRRLDCEMFPALAQRRNFWCIQRHQATALHYDLRMQVDGGTFSWAIPLGLLGMTPESRVRLAVETNPHPILYSVFEGSDGQRKGTSKTACGTLLWDVGEYTIDEDQPADSDSDSGDSDRDLSARAAGNAGLQQQSMDHGEYQEAKLRAAVSMNQPRRRDRNGNVTIKRRKFHFTLRGGRKLTNHSFLLVHTHTKYKGDGRAVHNWLLALPKGSKGYPWPDAEAEEGIWGRSVKSDRSLREVCEAPPLDIMTMMGLGIAGLESGEDISAING